MNVQNYCQVNSDAPVPTLVGAPYYNAPKTAKAVMMAPKSTFMQALQPNSKVQSVSAIFRRGKERFESSPSISSAVYGRCSSPKLNCNIDGVC